MMEERKFNDPATSRAEAAANVNATDCGPTVRDRQEELLRKAEEAQELIDNFIEAFDSVYVVNLPDGSLDHCLMSPNVMKKVGRVSGFPEVREGFLSLVCHPLDRSRMTKELDLATLQARLSSEPSYTVEFCSVEDGATLWKEMRVTALGENKIILGIVDGDLDIVKRHLAEKSFSEYFAIFAVDLDLEKLRIIRNEGVFRAFPVGKAFSYPVVMKAFAEHFLEEEPRKFFNQISDVDVVRQKLADEDKYTFSFRGKTFGDGRWIDMTCYVLRRNEDGTPALLSLGFSLVDSLGAERQELHAELRKQMETISGLTSEYTGLDYLNLDTDNYTSYQIAERIEDIKPYFDRYPKYTDMLRAFINSDLVHPDDKESLRAFFPSVEAIRHALDGKKSISTFFRRNYSGEFLWTEFNIVKCENAEEEAHNVILGFAEKDREVREKQERQQAEELAKRQMQLALEKADTESRRTELLYDIINGGKWVYDISADGEVLAAHYSNRATSLIDTEFVQTPLGWLEHLHPEDRERVTAEFQAAVSDPSGNTPYDTTFRVLESDGRCRWIKSAGRMLRHEDGSGELLGMTLDITEQMQEEEKRLSEKNEIERLRMKELELKHSEFRASSLAYLVEHEGNITSFLNFFAEKLRELVKCDQVIYRDENGNRYIHNASELGSGYEIAGETCLHCPHSDMHSPLYASGVTEMEDTAIGVDGVPVHRDCPVKSALTRTIQLDGNVCGYLAIHYILDYHHFSDYERQTLEEFSNLLSLSLSRYAARAKNAENDARVMANVAGDVATYILNVTNGKFRTLYQKGRTAAKRDEEEDFEASFSPYIDNTVYEQDRKMVRERISLPAFRALLKTGDREYRALYRDISGGRPRWYEMRATKFSDSEIVAGFSDVTEEHIEHLTFEKMEDDYFALFYAYLDSGTAYAIKDDPGILVGKGNTAPYAEMIGKLAMTMEGDNREFILQQGDKEYLNKKFAKEDKASYTYRSDFLDEEMWVNMTQIVLERDAEGNPLVLTLGFSFLDEEAKRAQKMQEKINEQQVQLAEALAMAESASNAKTSFLFNMSHDIRTPMNAILGFTQLVQKNLDDRERVEDYVGKIEQAGNHLLGLINDVLEMSRIESGKIMLNEVPTDIRKGGEALKAMLQNLAAEKKLDFSFKADAVKHVFLYVDPLRVNQVLINIISNAIKYTPKGGRVECTIEHLDSEKPGYTRARFTVADNGIGMSKEFVQKIFEPFSREKSSTVSRVEGTGLGMSIVKKIVDLMGGTITVQSEPGKGTTVVVEADFRIADRVEDKAVGKTSADFTGRKVLLVEDNELNREIATALLEESGFVISTAADGDIAVELMKKAQAGTYDLVLMDVQMPRMDGYEATRQIRALGTEISHLPIIAMTANAFEEDRKAALEAGMNEHIAKPINVEVLKETLARFL